MGNINPFQLIQLIKNGNNPQQLIMNYLQQNNQGNIPVLNNAANMAQNGNISGLQMIARNLAQQKGLDYDEAFKNFQQMLK